MAMSTDLNLLHLSTGNIRIFNTDLIPKIVVLRYCYPSALHITALSSSIPQILAKGFIPPALRNKIHIT